MFVQTAQTFGDYQKEQRHQVVTFRLQCYFTPPSHGLVGELQWLVHTNLVCQREV